MLWLIEVVLSLMVSCIFFFGLSWLVCMWGVRLWVMLVFSICCDCVIVKVFVL